MVFIQHTPGKEAIRELALRTYPTVYESFREAISNAYDEGSSKVSVEVLLKTISVEDWGGGIPDLDKFSEYGHKQKLERPIPGGRQPVGRKGMGKLSLLRISPVVLFKTCTGKFGIDIKMDMEGIHADYGGVNEFIDHIGTKIIIENPEETPPVAELHNYIKKSFGLLIAKGFTIFLNGQQLEPDTSLSTEEKLLFRLSGAVDVVGNIVADTKGKGYLDFYVNHVFVSREMVDPTREFSGWLNCDVLEPGTSRNQMVQDAKYDDVMRHLKQYVGRFPIHDTEEIDRAEIRVGNEIAKLLKSYMKDMKILHKSLVGVAMEEGGSGTQLVQRNNLQDTHADPHTNGTNPSPENPDAYKNKLHTSVLDPTKEVKRRLRTDFNVTIVYQEYGSEREPIFYAPPTTFVINTTNDLYTDYIMRDKMSLGARWVRMLPWLARCAIRAHPKYDKWSQDEINTASDQAFRHFLKEYGEL